MLSFQGTNNWPREWEINEGFLFDCGKGNTNPWTMRKELENSAVKKQKEANKWNKKNPYVRNTISNICPSQKSKLMSATDHLKSDLTRETRPIRPDPNPIKSDFLRKSNWPDPTRPDLTRPEIKWYSIQSKSINDLKKHNI
jgi:hypothetical protein